MKTLTREELIKQQNYRKQLILYFIFAIVGFSAMAVELFLCRKLDFNSIFQLGFIFLVIFIPFGIILGLRNIIKTFRTINRVKNSELRIRRMTVIDKRRVKSGTDNDWGIEFQNNITFFVNRNQQKKFSVGDECFVVFTDDSNDPDNIYPCKEYVLADDLRLTGDNLWT
jgi:hypothetical protein